MLIVEGAYAISQTLGGPQGPGREIVSAAEALVAAHLAAKPAAARKRP
jgi:hypothetical protein